MSSYFGSEHPVHIHYSKIRSQATLEKLPFDNRTTYLSSMGSSGGTTLVRIRVHSRNNLYRFLKEHKLSSWCPKFSKSRHELHRWLHSSVDPDIAYQRRGDWSIVPYIQTGLT